MRRASIRLLCTVVLCGLTAAGCRNRRSAPVEHKGQTVLLTKNLCDAGGSDTVRFGRLHSGEIAQRRIWLHNETDRPLLIETYERSCGCTTLEYDRKPIAPGEFSAVNLRFDSRGERGWQLRTVGIRFAGIDRPLRLVVEAEVE